MDGKAIIYPIGGGKGGVGKSFVTANLGVLLAKQGWNVLLIDLDLGGPNLHTFFGLDSLKSTLGDFLNKKILDINDAVIPTGFSNLSLISSKDSALDSANLPNAQKLKLIRAISKLEYDYILLDLGAGTHSNTLDFFLSSNEGIFVCTPHPTSIENTFLFIKTVFYRKLKLVLKLDTFRKMILSLSSVSGSRHVKLNELIEYAMEYDPEKGKELKEILDNFQFSFILNENSRQIDSKLGARIEMVYNRHFHACFRFLGNINYDEKVYDSILSRKIFVKKYPYTPAATDLQKIVHKLTGKNTQPFLNPGHIS